MLNDHDALFIVFKIVFPRICSLRLPVPQVFMYCVGLCRLMCGAHPDFSIAEADKYWNSLRPMHNAPLLSLEKSSCYTSGVQCRHHLATVSCSLLLVLRHVRVCARLAGSCRH